jgi:MFS family permease
MLSPVQQLRRRISHSGAAFRAVFANPGLRNLELAWALAILGQWAFVVAVSIYAFGAGGAQAVGLIILLRFGLAALTAPFAGLIADRYRRESVLLASALGRVVLLSAAAAGVFLDAQPVVVYALAVAAAIAATPFRSAQAALTPTLARTPDELTAANAVASTFESIATFAGPALAGLLLTVAGSGVVFAVTAGMLAVSALVLLRIHAPRTTPKGEVEASTLLHEALAGFRVVGREPALRVLMTLLAAQTFLFGTLQVYIVVLSVDTLDLGDAGVGYLNSAIGIGCVIGAILAMGLTGVSRLSIAFVTGVLLVGVPLVVLGLWTETASAVILLGVAGLGNSLLDVSGLTLVQRAVPEEVLARVFGVIQMLFYAALGIGAILAPTLMDWLDVDGALIATGLFLVVLTALLATQLVRIDAAAKAPEMDELNLLGRAPIFAPLPGATLEHLAARLVPLRLDAGEVVVREGDAGDRFYLVAEGELEVTAGGQQISVLSAGDAFGEIALLRDVSRTATVTARTPTVLYALDREEFLAAVTGHPASAQAAEAVIGARLSTFSPAGVKVTAS